MFSEEELEEEEELTERSDWKDDKGLKHDGEKWRINEMDEMLSYKTKLVISRERGEKKKRRREVNGKLLGSDFIYTDKSISG